MARDVKIWLAIHALSLTSLFFLAVAGFASFAHPLEFDHRSSVLKSVIIAFASLSATCEAAIYSQFRMLERTIKQSNNGPSKVNMAKKRHILAASIVARIAGIGACFCLASYADWLMYRSLSTVNFFACIVEFLAIGTLIADVQQVVKTQKKYREIESLGEALFASDDDEAEGQIFIE